MALKTADEYRNSVKDLGLEAHILGKKTGDLQEHGLVKPSQEAVAFTYQAAHDPETRELFCVESSLCNDVINRFTHLHRSTDDLIRQGQHAAALRRNVTAAAFNGVWGWMQPTRSSARPSTATEKHGTDYHQRFRDYWSLGPDEDLVVDGAMTDPKGDRGKRPKEQNDPDLFLRVVERRPGRRGGQRGQTPPDRHAQLPRDHCDAHPGHAPGRGGLGHLLCRAHQYRGAFSYIYGRQTSDTRKLEGIPSGRGQHRFGGQEVMTVFDDVFVPKDRIFLDGEVDFSGLLVERFAATTARATAAARWVWAMSLIGATALIARMNGVEKASHIKDKIVEMIHLNETMYACGIACSATGHPHHGGQL